MSKKYTDVLVGQSADDAKARAKALDDMAKLVQNIPADDPLRWVMVFTPEASGFLGNTTKTADMIYTVLSTVAHIADIITDANEFNAFMQAYHAGQRDMHASVTAKIEAFRGGSDGEAAPPRVQ